MKNKIILHSIGNEGNFNFYIFDKKQSIAKALSKIFYNLLNLSWDFQDIENEKEKNIEKIKDSHENLTRVGNKSRADVFYGNKKIFIVLHCSGALRLKFNEELFKIVKMPKPTKIKKIKWKKVNRK